MNLGILLASALWIVSPAPQGPPSANPTYPLRNTFVIATETVIDYANAADFKADDAHFQGQMHTLKEAQANLDAMASDDREQAVAAATKSLIFAVASCHIEAIDGVSTAKCPTQIQQARDTAMDAIGKHRSNGVWVDGPPS
ncbi:MAG: hypothetical protein ACRD6W_12875 [Nitrososphaerales archaeon]